MIGDLSTFDYVASDRCCICQKIYEFDKLYKKFIKEELPEDDSSPYDVMERHGGEDSKEALSLVIVINEGYCKVEHRVEE